MQIHPIMIAVASLALLSLIAWLVKPKRIKKEEEEVSVLPSLESNTEGYGKQENTSAKEITTARMLLTIRGQLSGMDNKIDDIKKAVVIDDKTTPVSTPVPVVKKKWRWMVVVDAGHGTLDKNGNYTTDPKIGKWFNHRSSHFHKTNTFYEGVSNRVIAELFIKKLEAVGIPYVRTYGTLDMPLAHRVDLANYHHQHVQPCLFNSFHSNATEKHNARGFQEYTYTGQSKSDLWATEIWKQKQKIYPSMMLKQDKVDGDVDFENKFFVLKHTQCPAVLSENLFFDQYEDALMLMNPKVQEHIAEAHFQAILWAQENLAIS